MKRENLEKLTKKFYLGETSPLEEKALFEEVKENESSRNYFESYESTFVQSYTESTYLQHEWNQFYSKYLDQAKVRKVQLLRNVTRYAAVVGLAVMLATGYALFEKWSQAHEPMVWYETYVPRGEKSQITLPDGTKVWLNAETTLRYPAQGYLQERRLQLSGEGYFEVAENEDVSFVVQTEDYDVVVTGTSFNIMAYEDFDRTETSLLSGKVEIHNLKGYNSTKEVELIPGKKIVFNKERKEVCVVDADTHGVVAWKQNEFMFSEVKFEELCRRLERWYDVDITLADPELKQISYTGNFRNEETIWQVLDIIKITTPIRYELKNRRLTIFKENLPME